MNFKSFCRVFYPLKGVINSIKNKFRPSLITTESHFALPLTLLFFKIYLNYCSQMGTLASKGLNTIISINPIGNAFNLRYGPKMSFLVL
jgi:hypothetical protein